MTFVFQGFIGGSESHKRGFSPEQRGVRLVYFEGMILTDKPISTPKFFFPWFCILSMVQGIHRWNQTEKKHRKREARIATIPNLNECVRCRPRATKVIVHLSIAQNLTGRALYIRYWLTGERLVRKSISLWCFVCPFMVLKARNFRKRWKCAKLSNKADRHKSRASWTATDRPTDRPTKRLIESRARD